MGILKVFLRMCVILELVVTVVDPVVVVIAVVVVVGELVVAVVVTVVVVIAVVVVLGELVVALVELVVVLMHANFIPLVRKTWACSISISVLSQRTSLNVLLLAQAKSPTERDPTWLEWVKKCRSPYRRF